MSQWGCQGRTLEEAGCTGTKGEENEWEIRSIHVGSAGNRLFLVNEQTAHYYLFLQHFSHGSS